MQLFTQPWVPVEEFVAPAEITYTFGFMGVITRGAPMVPYVMTTVIESVVGYYLMLRLSMSAMLFVTAFVMQRMGLKIPGDIAVRSYRSRRLPKIPKLLFPLVIVSLLLASGGGVAMAQSSLLIGLVALWEMDETSGTRYDSTANDYDLTSNKVGYTTGVMNAAALFVGADNLSISDNQDLSGCDCSFSFSAWVMLSDKSDERNIIKKAAGTDQLEFWLFYDFEEDDIVYYTSSDGLDIDGNLRSTTAPAIDTWAHIVVVNDKTANETTMYINGSAVVSTTFSSVYNGTADFVVSDGTFYGSVDQVGFWKRALNDEEVAALYNEGAGWEYPWEAPTPTPTPTATPTVTPTPAPTADPGAYFAEVDLSSGQTVRVRYEISFGEMIASGALLALVVISLARMIYGVIVRTWRSDG